MVLCFCGYGIGQLSYAHGIFLPWLYCFPFFLFKQPVLVIIFTSHPPNTDAYKDGGDPLWCSFPWLYFFLSFLNHWVFLNKKTRAEVSHGQSIGHNVECCGCNKANPHTAFSSLTFYPLSVTILVPLILPYINIDINLVLGFLLP